jgi:hypothetical protein
LQEPHLQNNHSKNALEVCSSSLQCLLFKYKAMSSNPSSLPHPQQKNPQNKVGEDEGYRDKSPTQVLWVT